MYLTKEVNLPLSRGTQEESLRVIIADEMWQWFILYGDEVILSVGFLFFKFKITVDDLRPLFIRLFGDPPPNSMYA